MGSMLDRALLSRLVLEAVQHIKPLTESAGSTRAQFALAWTLRKPEVASAIIGATRVKQIEDNVIASAAAGGSARVGRLDFEPGIVKRVRTNLPRRKGLPGSKVSSCR